jgi:hypothetical protein
MITGYNSAIESPIQSHVVTILFIEIYVEGGQMSLTTDQHLISNRIDLHNHLEANYNADQQLHDGVPFGQQGSYLLGCRKCVS